MKRLANMLPSVVLLLSVQVACHAQSSEIAPDASGPTRFTLSIATKQSTYKVGEKILVSIILKNISDEKYCENHFLETGEADLNGYRVSVVTAGGVPLLLVPRPKYQGMRSRGKLCIDPGKSHAESIILNQIVDLSAAGVYQIHVDHLDGEKNAPVDSNKINVTITP